MILLGLDAGSTAIKCVAFSEEGRQLALAYTEYGTSAGAGNMDADAMFAAAKQVIARCTADDAVDASDIAAIAVTSFGEACVPVDRDGACLSNMLMYTDNRGQLEAKRVLGSLGADRVGEITCTEFAPMYSLPKIIWLMENDSTVRERAYKFLQAADFICYRLSGALTSNYAHSCRTAAFDVEARRFSEEILGAAGLDPALMPDPVPCGTVVGTILPDLAAELGLPASMRVVQGSHDQIAAATGAGVLAPGQAVDGTGTVECITPVFDHIIRDREFVGSNFACVPHSVEGLYATYAFNFSGGVLLKWIRDSFASEERRRASELGCSAYKLLDEACPSEISDLLVVPHFLGAGGTPDVVPTAKGSIIGMTMQTGVGEIYRAAMEGLTYEMAYNLEKLAPFGISITDLMATGGGSCSPIWLRIKADIFGAVSGIRSITPLLTAEAGAAGCAMLAGIAVGLYSSLDEAAKLFVLRGDPVVPDASVADRYIEKYEKYKKIRNFALDMYR